MNEEGILLDIPDHGKWDPSKLRIVFGLEPEHGSEMEDGGLIKEPFSIVDNELTIYITAKRMSADNFNIFIRGIMSLILDDLGINRDTPPNELPQHTALFKASFSFIEGDDGELVYMQPFAFLYYPEFPKGMEDDTISISTLSVR